MNRQKKKLVQRLAEYRPSDTLPPDLQDALQKHPDIQAEWQQTHRLVSLLSLKQYERPGPDVASRCRSSVLRQLRSVDSEESYPFFDWRWDGATPLLRLGLAAVFLALIGLQFVSSPDQGARTAGHAELGSLTFTPSAPAEMRRAAAPARSTPIDFSAIGITNWPAPTQQVGVHSLVNFGQ